jgi:hypothetical protein
MAGYFLAMNLLMLLKLIEKQFDLAVFALVQIMEILDP